MTDKEFIHIDPYGKMKVFRRKLNLSERVNKIRIVSERGAKDDVYSEENVKEFIRQIRVDIIHLVLDKRVREFLLKRIDKLAGDKLVEANQEWIVIVTTFYLL